jgi:hypothetical protein
MYDWISTGTQAILSEVFCGFPQSLRVKANIIPRLDHDRFLTNPFQCIIIHKSSYHPTIYSLDTERVIK